MCPAVANQCHRSLRLLYEMHSQNGGNVSTFTLLSIKGLAFNGA